MGDHVTLYDAFKPEFSDKKSIEEKYGFPLDRLPFYFALCGDSSDNIPGVRGIGPKGATDLVKQFASLADMYEHIDQVPKERTRELLIASRDNAFLSEKLFLLQYTPLHLTENDVAFSVNYWVKARSFFEKYDFKSLLKELPTGVTQGAIAQTQEARKPQAQFVLINDLTALDALVAQIKKIGAFACDTETDGRAVMTAKLVGVSIALEPGTAYYIPFDHVHEGVLAQTDVLARLRPIFEDTQIKKYFHHAKFDMHVLASVNLQVQGLAFDTLVAASLLRKDGDRIGLKALSETYFQETMLSYDEVVSKNKYKDFSHVPLELATQYAAADAHQTLKLVTVLWQELERENLFVLFETLEMPLVSILFAMEQRGIICDPQVLRELGVKVAHDLEKNYCGSTNLAGRSFLRLILIHLFPINELSLAI